MRCRRWAAMFFAMAIAANPQDFAPGVVTLAHIKSHMRDEAANLPNYTCLESLTRFHKEARHAAQTELKPLDTVRLEIVYSDHQEWYGSPGDKKTAANNPSEFVGNGLIGTGVFASALNNILTGAQFTYGGEEELNGRNAIRYDFQYSRLTGGFEVNVVGGRGTVGQKGSIWADPKTLDLIRLESAADDIPSWLPLVSSGTSVDYARTRIGDRSILLAQQGSMRMVPGDGTEDYDRVEFTHCRAFSSETTLRFDTSADETPVVASSHATAAPPTITIPANQMATVRLVTAISSDAAVGDLIEGALVGAITRNGTEVIPEGAVVRGRIRRLEHHQRAMPQEYILALEFTEVEIRGGSVPFYADFLRTDKSRNIRPILPASDKASPKQNIILPDLPGVASFFVSGASFAIPAGFTTVWRTRGPIRK